MADASAEDRFLTPSAPTGTELPPSYNEFVAKPTDYPADVLVPSPYGASIAISGLPPPASTAADALPPSYDSLYGKVKAAKAASTGKVNGITKIIGTVGWIIILVAFLALPIAMITLGSLGLKKCPREPFVPIYLVVGGVFGSISALFYACTYLTSNSDNEDEDGTNGSLYTLSCCTTNLFQFSWFIAGNYWTYRIHNDFQTYDSSRSNYCDYTTYYFAFWLITTVYISIGVFICGFFGAVIVAVEKEENAEKNTRAQDPENISAGSD